MAYRRRGGMTRASTFQEDVFRRPHDNADDVNVKNINKKLSSSHIFTASSSSSSSSSASLAAQAIRASAAYRDSSLSSSYAADSVPHRSMVFDAYEDTSARNDSKGFWGVLARKAKAILDDDSLSQQLQAPAKSSFHMSDISTTGQHSYPVSESVEKTDHPPLRKGLDKITSSLNHIGDTFEKAFEEGRHIVENKTADIIQGTRKLQIRQKGNSPEAQVQQFGATSAWQQPNVHSAEHQNQQMNRETQLKASRDVAMATAAKAKLLLRELKTLKADLAFEKQRCSQLEEENKILRESHQKGDYPADDDLIRLQLETLLAEKARLAHENSIYARENRFLREIVEYHQLTMQDVVYLDEGSEEVTEIYSTIKMLSISPPSPMSPTSPSEISTSASSLVTKEVFPMQLVPNSDGPQNTGAVNLKEEDTESILVSLEEDKNTLQVLGENTK